MRITGYEFIDAAQVIVFTEEMPGLYDDEKTMEKLTARLENVEKAVIPGFYGAMEDGRVKTFSRGGSDITGSIVAKAVRGRFI